ncbi:hypothetical protein GCM10027299_07200 [Larkinella ripae]
MALGALTWSCDSKTTHQPEPKPQPETLQLQKITSGEKSFQNFGYNAQGQLANFQSYWIYTDSASTVYSQNAEFQYDDQQRLSQISSNGKPYVKFFYEGKVLDRAEEYDHRNRLVITHTYLFNAEGRIVELLDLIHDPYEPTSDPVSYLKSRYEYDGRGNVQRVQSFTRRVGDPAAKAWQNTYYEGYDDKKNPQLPEVNYPFLPQMRTMVNNPGKITVKSADNNTVLVEERNTYGYNEQGYPVRRTQQVTTTKPLPTTTVNYHYK